MPAGANPLWIKPHDRTAYKGESPQEAEKEVIKLEETPQCGITERATRKPIIRDPCKAVKLDDSLCFCQSFVANLLFKPCDHAWFRTKMIPAAAGKESDTSHTMKHLLAMTFALVAITMAHADSGSETSKPAATPSVRVFSGTWDCDMLTLRKLGSSKEIDYGQGILRIDRIGNVTGKIEKEIPDRTTPTGSRLVVVNIAGKVSKPKRIGSAPDSPEYTEAIVNVKFADGATGKGTIVRYSYPEGIGGFIEKLVVVKAGFRGEALFVKR